MRRSISALALSFALLLALGCSSTTGGAGTAQPVAPGGDASSGAPTAGALVAERCTKCHDLGRIKAASKDEGGWRKTVTRMRSNGAQVTEDEMAQIVKFLASGGSATL